MEEADDGRWVKDGVKGMFDRNNKKGKREEREARPCVICPAYNLLKISFHLDPSHSP